MDLVERELLAREDWDEIKDAVGTTNMKKKRTRYLMVISWHVETMLHIMILGGLWNPPVENTKGPLLGLDPSANKRP